MTEKQHDYWWIGNVANTVPRPTGFAATELDEFDVIVVGAGMAGMCTAVLAHDAGASVLVLEASDEVGGTTYKSGGAMWIPDNAFMRELGIRDDRDTVMRYIVRVAHEDLYDADAPRYGVGEWEWETIGAFVDNASDALDSLVASGAFDISLFYSYTERYPALPTYHPDLDMSIQGFYRHIAPKHADGSTRAGAELVSQLGTAIRSRGIPLLTRRRVKGLVQDEAGAVVGVKAGESTYYARRGVVFGSGGFAHNLELLDEYWRGPLWSSCAVSTAQGDFVTIGLEAGAELAHMRNGWLYEDLLEKAALNRENQDKGIPVPPGDSMIYVDGTGKRVVNEKLIYQDRNRLIWDQDEDGGYPNRVLVMVYDEFVSTDTKPTLFFETFHAPKPWIIQGSTLAELAERIQERQAGLEELTDGFRLAPGFAEQLAETVERFNGFARTGVDEDFHRSETMTEYDWHGLGREGNDKNPGMYPFREEGPYFAVLLCGMVLDTNGGPKANGRSQVLRADGTVIPGLYGAGNCVASIAGDGYLSLGSTLGPAAAFAYLAARNVLEEPVRDLSSVRDRAVVSA